MTLAILIEERSRLVFLAERRRRVARIAFYSTLALVSVAGAFSFLWI